ncbi:RimK family alpha-L-glutamate ligase [Picrophilus oshimae]|uniref:RimK-like protein n=1 Tax=Picrophilus torridus (strain ATCC 700027 / DSM 9790 / JCM 10055 / NBRC 100828 / KAW 2/3) TaxID=1122961 RepID=Q6KZ00_PICTO|nr:RimK family alpha-L-glutamate ligase [Picrophilus oshimae]AAT44052.1 RimK-like protein [Picrophilus oshimae DSM 9789]
MIHLAYDIPAWEEKEIIKELSNRNIDYDTINVNKNSFKIKSMEKNDLVMIRCISSTRSLYFSKIAETYGFFPVNNYNTINISSNKAITSMILEKNSIKTPETYISFSMDMAIETAENLGYPVVIKPVSGSWGRMVSICRSRTELRDFLEYYENISNVFYIQKYVNRPARDIRAIVAGENIIAATYRYQGQSWKTNTHLGGRVERANLSEEQKEIIIKTASIFKNSILGIDAMEDENEITVHEINSRVEFKGAAQVHGRKIVTGIVDFIYRLARC